MYETRVIRIFEDSQTKLILSAQNIKDILLMKNIIGENNILLQADGKLLVRHYVGFIQKNKTRLLIYPKISKGITSGDEFNKSFAILIKLLAYSGFGNVKKIPTPQSLDKYEGDLLELFIGLFVDELLLQFKRDINRGYNSQIENQTFIKGKIDFVETIKKNSFKKHLHYVRYDQFSENILLNRIFKSVIKNLITRTNSKENKIKLSQSLLWLEDVENIVLDTEIWKRVKFTRHNSKYRPAFNMAKLFYYNSSPNLNIGDENTFSFLVPMNQLFELYIFKILKGQLLEDLEIKYQSPIKYLAYNDDKKYLQLRPDITLTSNSQVKYIIDAKYKEVLDEGQEISISQADIYQMLAYSVRYECDNIALIYPKLLADGQSELLIQEFNIENYNRVVSIKIIKTDLEMEPSQLGKELVYTLRHNYIPRQAP